jgi:hypothetical protein
MLGAGVFLTTAFVFAVSFANEPIVQRLKPAGYALRNIPNARGYAKDLGVAS